jgi:hypothetical protein
MSIFALNVISIVIALLITRVIIAWVYALQSYMHSKVYIDMDERELDCDVCKHKLLAALLVTLLAAFIVIMILKAF